MSGAPLTFFFFLNICLCGDAAHALPLNPGYDVNLTLAHECTRSNNIFSRWIFDGLQSVGESWTNRNKSKQMCTFFHLLWQHPQVQHPSCGKPEHKHCPPWVSQWEKSKETKQRAELTVDVFKGHKRLIHLQNLLCCPHTLVSGDHILCSGLPVPFKLPVRRKSTPQQRHKSHSSDT